MKRNPAQWKNIKGFGNLKGHNSFVGLKTCCVTNFYLFVGFKLCRKPVVILSHFSQICEVGIISGFFVCKLQNRIRHHSE